MTPKERVRATLRHEEPDFVPIGEFAIDYPMYEAVLGRPSYWRGHFKTTKALWEGRRDEVVESMIADVIEFYHKSDQDIIPVSLVPSKHEPIVPMKEIAPGTFQDERGNLYRVAPKSEWLICVKHADPDREYSVDDFPIPTEFEEPDESSWELVRAVVGEFGDTHFILARSGDGTFPQPGGMERGLVLFAEAPEVIEQAARAAVAGTIAMDRLWVREGVDGLCPGTDYADSRGPLVSPSWIRQRLFPSMQDHVNASHTLGVPIVKHACGNNWRIMELLIEAGYDAYQSIQESATMDIVRLKREYGEKIALWGGVNTETLVAGTPDDVRDEVRRAVRYCAPGGGFLLGTSHSVLVGADYDNYMAMLDEARRVGKYPVAV